MKNILITGAIAFCITTIFSCKKSDDTTPASTANLTIVSPVLNQIYKKGDSVHIQGTATNVANLHGYHTFILNASNDTLFHAESHTHAVQLNIDEKWLDTLSTPQNLRVIVVSTINHEGDEIKKEVAIKSEP